MRNKTKHYSPRELLSIARASAVRVKCADSDTARYKICTSLLTDRPHPAIDSRFASAITGLGDEEKHFWIGTFYTLLLPAHRRRSQATYFTPPHLANAMVRLLHSQGFDLLNHSVIDPAAGGAAFLSTIASEMRTAGATNGSIRKRLNGIEVDSGLARLAEALIQARTGAQIDSGSVVQVKDSLKARISSRYDLVIANPPFGRLFSTDLPDQRWQKLCHPGHINKSALFAELCFRLAKPRGLVALVMPSSFLAGPLYGRLREYIRQNSEVLALGSLATRKDIFLDVAQDVSVLIARAGEQHQAEQNVSFGSFAPIGNYRALATGLLPKLDSAAWVASVKSATSSVGGATLEDYGARIRAGYFVWNRETARMRTRASSKRCVPLVWAVNIKPGKFCSPVSRKRNGIDFVRFEGASAGITRSNAIVIQRTTNNSQKRRIVAARVSPSVLKRYGGFTAENHTIVLTGPDVRALDLLALLLNSKAVDERYRRVSGTASVSVNLLRQLDLPSPDALLKATKELGYTDEAVAAAYKMRGIAKAVCVA